MRAVLPVAKQNTSSAGMLARLDSSAIRRRMPSGCTPEPAGPSVPRITRCGHLSCSAACAAAIATRSLPLCTISIARATRLAQLAHMRFGQRGVAAVDVADDVGVGLEHHVLVDQARARDRRAAGVDGALDAVLARPGHHLLRLVAGLDRAEADLAEQRRRRPAASSLKSLSTMPFSITGAPASTLTPPGRKLSKARCAVIASAFRPTMSFGRPGRCTSPAEIIVVTPPFIVRVDPAELALARRPVAEHRVHVAVDQARARRRSSCSRSRVCALLDVAVVLACRPR